MTDGNVGSMSESNEMRGVGIAQHQDADESPLEASASRSHRRPRRPRDWVQGGTSTQPLTWMTLAWVVVSLGLGLLAANLANALVGGETGARLGTLALWAGMLVPVVVVFVRTRPRGLFRFRGTDLLFGVVLGLALRVFVGWIEGAVNGRVDWPAYPSLGGSWIYDELITTALIAPIVETLFFNGVLLVTLYTVFRRLTDQRIAAGVAAALTMTGTFMLVHAATGSLGTVAVIAAVALVGVATATLVLVTGRIWGALVLHVVFNASYVVLAVVGTIAGVSTGGSLS